MSDPSNPADRRDFLNTCVGVGILSTLASMGYPVASYLLPPPESGTAPDSVVGAREGELPLNSGKIVRFGVKPVLLIHRPDGSYGGFYAGCTHLDCTVQYRQDLQMIHCACHNGLYDLQGRNVSGPPPRPLEPLRVKQRGEEIVLTRET